MRGQVVYLWGAAGGFAAASLVYVVPVLTRLVDGEDFDLDTRRVVGVTLLLGLLTALAGLVPLTRDAVTRGEAILLGLGSQVFLKGLMSGAYDVWSAGPARGTPRSPAPP